MGFQWWCQSWVSVGFGFRVAVDLEFRCANLYFLLVLGVSLSLSLVSGSGFLVVVSGFEFGRNGWGESLGRRWDGRTGLVELSIQITQHTNGTFSLSLSLSWPKPEPNTSLCTISPNPNSQTLSLCLSPDLPTMRAPNGAWLMDRWCGGQGYHGSTENYGCGGAWVRGLRRVNNTCFT